LTIFLWLILSLENPRLGPKVGIRLLHVDIGLTPPKVGFD
jgi:hypothetical protein